MTLVFTMDINQVGDDGFNNLFDQMDREQEGKIKNRASFVFYTATTPADCSVAAVY